LVQCRLVLCTQGEVVPDTGDRVGRDRPGEQHPAPPNERFDRPVGAASLSGHHRQLLGGAFGQVSAAATTTPASSSAAVGERPASMASATSCTSARLRAMKPAPIDRHQPGPDRLRPQPSRPGDRREQLRRKLRGGQRDGCLVGGQAD
jgi:hypothetical protein